MTRFYVRFMLCALVTVGFATLLVHAQPYDDYELRWLPVNNCFTACFMGIRPGKTTLEEAAKLLKAHPWVNQVVTLKEDNPYQMGWTWSDNAPPFLRNVRMNPTSPINGEIFFDKGIVSNIGFSTHLTFGDIALAWRYPDDSQLILPGLMIAPDASVLALINIEYQGFRVSGTLNCPYAMHIWQTPIRINVMANNMVDFDPSTVSTFIPVDKQNFLGSIRHASDLMCSRQY